MTRDLVQTKEREIIEKLVAWATYMGGFDAQVWRDAENVIKSDSDSEHFESLEKEELSELANQLHAAGFSKRAITAAFKNVEKKNS